MRRRCSSPITKPRCRRVRQSGRRRRSGKSSAARRHRRRCLGTPEACSRANRRRARAPRAVRERGHRHHDEIRPDLAQCRVVEAQFRQHLARVVSLPRPRARQAAWRAPRPPGGQIERDAELVAVEHEEVGALLGTARCSKKAARVSLPRHQSGWPHALIFTTSAPRSAMWRETSGPAQPIVKSTTRTPASGRSARPDTGAAGTVARACHDALPFPSASGATPPARGEDAVSRSGISGASRLLSQFPLGHERRRRRRLTCCARRSLISGTMANGSFRASASAEPLLGGALREAMGVEAFDLVGVPCALRADGEARIGEGRHVEQLQNARHCGVVEMPTLIDPWRHLKMRSDALAKRLTPDARACACLRPEQFATSRASRWLHGRSPRSADRARRAPASGSSRPTKAVRPATISAWWSLIATGRSGLDEADQAGQCASHRIGRDEVAIRPALAERADGDDHQRRVDFRSAGWRAASAARVEQHVGLRDQVGEARRVRYCCACSR